MAKIYFHKNTKAIIPLNLFHQYSQLLATLLVGALFLFFFPEFKWIFNKIPFPEKTYPFLLGLGLVSLTVFIMLKKKLIAPVYHWLNKNIKTALEVQVYAFLKYFSFSIQYLILLVFFEVEASNLVLLAAISITYLLASLIPANLIVDIGIKTTWGIVLFGYLGVEASVIVFISFSMWVLNFAIPALLGGLFILKSKPKLNQLVNQPKWS
ncbi:MAG: hypothetical protein LAT51_04010 [Flavobacteriaceae bacterium]|nr:hypothetical protein [Flavobacteriaceae bacterium]